MSAMRKSKEKSSSTMPTSAPPMSSEVLHMTQRGLDESGGPMQAIIERDALALEHGAQFIERLLQAVGHALVFARYWLFSVIRHARLPRMRGVAKLRLRAEHHHPDTSRSRTTGESLRTTTSPSSAGVEHLAPGLNDHALPGVCR